MLLKIECMQNTPHGPDVNFEETRVPFVSTKMFKHFPEILCNSIVDTLPH